MWRRPGDRMALLELLARGRLKRRRSQADAHAALAELPWTRATGRRDEIALVPERRHELVSLLDRVWPEWGAALAELTAHGLAPNPDGWGALEDARRAAGLTAPLPEQLNRRTAAALAAPHSKATLTERRKVALGEVDATHDGSVRLRPPAGLVARGPRGAVDLSAIAAVLGEVAIPERALRAGLAIEGAPRAVLLVENLGAWRDLPAPPGWLLVHVPGWDTATVLQLLDRVPRAPLVHFGDVDPNGVRIYQHLRARRPDARWFVPDFWRELVATKGLAAAWPDDLDLDDAPELVREVARAGIWLEQEPLVVDPRIARALERLIDDPD